MMGLDYRTLRFLLVFSLVTEALLCYDLLAYFLDWPVVPAIVPVSLVFVLGGLFFSYFLQVMRRNHETAQR